MQQATNRSWTAYENHLAVEHQRKINRPPLPREEPLQRPPDEVLFSCYQLLQDTFRLLPAESRFYQYQVLRTRISLMFDGSTGLGAKSCFSLFDHVHQGPYMAVKVKGLKALRGIGPAGRRGKILDFMGREVRASRLVAFAGHMGRFYVLLPEPWDGVQLARSLDNTLDRIVDVLGLCALPDPPRLRLIFGFGRTWEEAHLITRGRIRQADVPLDLSPPKED